MANNISATAGALGFAIGMASFYVGSIANQLISKKLGISPPNPPQAGSGA